MLSEIGGVRAAYYAPDYSGVGMKFDAACGTSSGMFALIFSGTDNAGVPRSFVSYNDALVTASCGNVDMSLSVRLDRSIVVRLSTSALSLSGAIGMGVGDYLDGGALAYGAYCSRDLPVVRGYKLYGVYTMSGSSDNARGVAICCALTDGPDLLRSDILCNNRYLAFDLPRSLPAVGDIMADGDNVVLRGSPRCPYGRMAVPTPMTSAY